MQERFPVTTFSHHLEILVPQVMVIKDKEDELTDIHQVVVNDVVALSTRPRANSTIHQAQTPLSASQAQVSPSRLK